MAVPSYFEDMVSKTKRDPAVTSRIMSAVKSKDSKAELAIRSALHTRGWRYRIHYSEIVGRPDIVFTRRRIAVFVDGDFWHGNAWRLRGLSSLEELFPNNRDFWVSKIRRNQARDEQVTKELTAEGWRVIRIWESEIEQDLQGCVGRIESVLRR